MTDRKRTKENKGKVQSPEQLATPGEPPIGRRFVRFYDKAWLLVEYPHSCREWSIGGPKPSRPTNTKFNNP